jgi:hypothetical protein
MVAVLHDFIRISYRDQLQSFLHVAYVLIDATSIFCNCDFGNAGVGDQTCQTHKCAVEARRHICEVWVPGLIIGLAKVFEWS